MAFLPAPPSKNVPHPRPIHSCTPTNPPPPLRPRPPCRPSPPPLHQRPNHRSPTYHTHAINKQAKSGNLRLLKDAVQTAKRDGYKLNAINYTTIANAYAEHAHPSQAFVPFAQMRDTAIRPTNATLRVAIKAVERWRGQPAIAAMMESLRWIAHRCSDPPCLRTWNLALRCLLRCKAWSELKLVLSWMEAGRIPNLISNIPHPDAISYNTCLLALQNQGRLRDAIFLFARMATCASVPPDVATYNTLLHMAVATDPVILNKQDICGSHFVHAVLQSMRRRNVSTTVTTETLVFRLLCRGTASDLRLVRERYTALLADTDANQLLDKMYFDAAITAFAHAKDLNGMNDALCRMANLSLRPDGLTIRALLAGARYLGDVQLAEGILKIAHRNRIPPDSVHYTTAITACRYAAPPNVEAADEFLQTALAHGATWTPAMVNAAVATYGADVSKALALWKRLRTCEHAPSREVLKERGVYDSLMRVCGRAGRPDLALRIFYAARSAGHLNGNSSDSQSVYNAFRRGVSEGGLDEIVEGNLLKRKYVEHLKLECGVADQIDQLDLPIERIRIKF